MVAQPKFLIGNGESLVTRVTQNSGAGDKAHPYEFADRVRVLTPVIEEVLGEVDALPDAACPDDEAVIALTLHPSYLARSYHPSNMLRELGLRQVGSREESVDPLRSLRKEPIHKMTELFIAGPRPALRGLLPARNDKPSDAFKEDFRKIETVRALGSERLRGALEGEAIPLEVVLHVAGDGEGGDRIYLGFEEWCEAVGIELLGDRMVGGLAFVNARADDDMLEDLVKFPFLRLVRRMPKLSFRPVSFRTAAVDETFEESR